MSDNQLAPAGPAPTTANVLGPARAGAAPPPAPLAPPPPAAPVVGIPRSAAEARIDSAMVAQLMSHWNESSDGSRRSAETSFTPLGVANPQAAVRLGPLGDLSGRADNAYLGQTMVGTESGRSADGTFFGQSHLSQRTGVDNLGLAGSSLLGQSSAFAGSAGVGTEASSRATYNPATGATTLGADGFTGARASDVRLQGSSGPLRVGASAGDLRYGVGGSGAVSVDPSTGQVNATGQGRGGGFSATDVRTQAQLGNLASLNTSAGGISNDATVTGARAQLSRSGLDASVDEVRTPGTRASDLAASYRVAGVGSGNATLGEVSTDNYVRGGQVQVNSDGIAARAREIDFFTGGPGVRLQNGNLNARNDLLGTSTHADFESIGNNNTIKDAEVRLDANNPGLRARVGEVSYGDWSGSNINVSAQGPGDSSGKAHLDSFGHQIITANDVRFDADRTGVHTSASKLGYDEFQLSNLQSQARLGNFADANLSLGRGAYQHFEASGARAGIDGNGLSAHLDRGQYDMVQLQNVDASARLGPLASGHVHLDEGGYNHVAASNVNAGLDRSGLHASLDNGEYRYLYGRNLDLQSSTAGGLMSSRVHADLASVGGVTADHLDYNTNLMNTNLSARNLNAHGFQGQNVAVEQNVAGVGVQAQAGQLNLADLQVRNLNAQTRNFGTAGNVNVEGARLDALNLRGGRAGLSVGGQELVGAGGDVRVGGSVDQAQAQYNLLRGQASGQFSNLNAGAQLNNGSVSVLGNTVHLPSMGAQVQASGGGAVDVGQGRANANLSLAGSSVNFAGHQVELGQWAQADAGVNLRQGAANVNLGGANGVGANVNLSQGDVRVNAFGHELNVGQGVRDVGHGIANGARSAWHSVFG